VLNGIAIYVMLFSTDRSRIPISSSCVTFMAA